VDQGREADYLTAIRDLAALLARRGQRIWVFRSPTKPYSFLEFSESATLLSHRVRSSRTPEELRLERRIQDIVTYAPGSWDMWEEIPFEVSAPEKE
jgi:hypothetical protein